jgi:hypothetical protein
MEAIGIKEVPNGDLNRYTSIAQHIFAALSDSGPEKSEEFNF